MEAADDHVRPWLKERRSGAQQRPVIGKVVDVVAEFSTGEVDGVLDLDDPLPDNPGNADS